MPPGNSAQPNADPEMEIHLARLREMLERTTIQALRQAARLWGRTLKGTAKADLVEQMLNFLGDAAGMAQAVKALSREDLAVLNWLAALGAGHISSKQIRFALAEGSGIRLTQKAIDEIVQSLTERCLLFYNEYQGYYLPSLFRKWLPAMESPKLLYAPVERLRLPTLLTVAAITQHAQHLMSALAAEQPLATVQPKTAPRYLAGRTEPLDPRRPSLIAAPVLARWGYVTPNEQLLARFLLEQLANARLLQIAGAQPGASVVTVASSGQDWEMETALEQLRRLRGAYLVPPREGENRLNSWSEWDLVFAQELSQSIQSAGYYASNDSLLQQTRMVGVWLSGLVANLPVDSWIGIEQFYKLIYLVQRDLLATNSRTSYCQWMEGNEALDMQQISFERWMRTQGRLVEAWLTGPASWLMFVQIGYAGNQPAAFRRPSVLPSGEAVKAPPDALRFMADGMIGLTNDWRANDLRRLLRSISVEAARDASTTLLRLDAGAFRATLQAGQDIAAISQQFAAAGFPLPPSVLEILRTWQRRAGRYQLYEQMTVVEFGEDVLPEELRAISRLSSAEFYQPGPRCLIFPDPLVAPVLTEELRRRGYTPQVLS